MTMISSTEGEPNGISVSEVANSSKSHKSQIDDVQTNEHQSKNNKSFVHSVNTDENSVSSNTETISRNSVSSNLYVDDNGCDNDECRTFDCLYSPLFKNILQDEEKSLLATIKLCL
ncbi:hypothetical protein RF11_09879 [Thelohanellus kitauei]|uniref:Uncharacterized protein n=1 Tax=Thelohanellus kitauei TaxID=669202 RepID=A0A0C2MAP2_THEKT|nr:hypothetical protein RF11_09879 [Thelohanellus kitauei]